MQLENHKLKWIAMQTCAKRKYYLRKTFTGICISRVEISFYTTRNVLFTNLHVKYELIFSDFQWNATVWKLVFKLSVLKVNVWYYGCYICICMYIYVISEGTTLQASQAFCFCWSKLLVEGLDGWESTFPYCSAICISLLSVINHWILINLFLFVLHKADT